jgi:hypothetical protein
MYSYSVYTVQYMWGGGETGGQINTCRQVPLLVNFEEKSTFRVWCLYSYLVYGSLYELFTRMAVYSKSYVADGDLVEENLVNLNDPVADLNMVSSSREFFLWTYIIL